MTSFYQGKLFRNNSNEVFFDLDGEAFNQNWLGAGFKYNRCVAK